LRGGRSKAKTEEKIKTGRLEESRRPVSFSSGLYSNEPGRRSRMNRLVAFSRGRKHIRFNRTFIYKRREE